MSERHRRRSVAGLTRGREKHTRPVDVNCYAASAAEGLRSAADFIDGLRSAELRAIYAAERLLSMARSASGCPTGLQGDSFFRRRLRNSTFIGGPV